MLYVIGTSLYDFVEINEFTMIYGDKYYYRFYVGYDSTEPKYTLFKNKCDAEDILKRMKDKNNEVCFHNVNIFACIEEFATPKPKIEDLKIYRLVAEEVE